jgi:hypothetical protein
MLWKPSVCLNIVGKESATRSNLIGTSTSKELMTDVRLVLGGAFVLDPVSINATQQRRHRKRRAHFIVSLSVLVVFAEPNHDDDMCRVCRVK